jgi:leucyl-tRNA synthetase
MRLEKGKFVSRRILVAKHQLIHEVTQGIRRLRLHSAISAFHRFFKVLEDPTTTDEEMDRGSIRTFLILLSPFAPHLASELWTLAEGEGNLDDQAWPEASSELLHPPEIEVVVKVNNRFHCLLKVASGLEKEKFQKAVLGNDRILEFLAGRSPARVVAVPDRIVNILLEESAKDQPAASS